MCLCLLYPSPTIKPFILQRTSHLSCCCCKRVIAKPHNNYTLVIYITCTSLNTQKTNNTGHKVKTQYRIQVKYINWSTSANRRSLRTPPAGRKVISTTLDHWHSFSILLLKQGVSPIELTKVGSVDGFNTKGFVHSIMLILCLNVYITRNQ